MTLKPGANAVPWRVTTVEIFSGFRLVGSVRPPLILSATLVVAAQVLTAGGAVDSASFSPIFSMTDESDSGFGLALADLAEHSVALEQVPCSKLVPAGCLK